MIRPTLKRERELWKSGTKLVAGLDEAGRGAWAGPVVAAVVILPTKHKQVDGITDSKLISAKQRAEYYEIITEQAIDFGVGIVDHLTIDRVGILEATKMACAEAISMLASVPDYLLCDALDLSKHVGIEQEAIIKGDQKIYTISCASIIAKVTRDNLMSNLGGEYNNYHFYQHKGYGTKLHQEKLAQYGISDIHRKSYKPIAKYCE